jgi:hypothetical protein
MALYWRLLHGFLSCFNFDALAFDVETNPTKNVHVEIRYPHERETCNQITAPIIEEKFVSSDDKKKSSHVMAETVFTGEQVEKFPFGEFPADFTVLRAPFARFPKDLLVGDGPRYGCNRDSKYEQVNYLFAGRFHLDCASVSRSGKAGALLNLVIRAERW